MLKQLRLTLRPLKSLQPGVPVRHLRQQAEVIEVIAQIGAGLAEMQDAVTGLWRNEVSQPLARLETSCTTGIVYVFARCILASASSPWSCAPGPA